MTILFDGIASGVLLFLVSVGLAVTLGLMNFVNLAHGAFAMAGGYVCVTLLNRLGVPFLLTLPLAAAAAALLGVVLERLLYRRLYRASHLDQVLFSIGLVFVAVSSAQYLFGAQQQPLQLPAMLSGQLHLPGMDVGVYRLFLIVIGLALAFALQWMVAHTAFGARLRASVDNPRAARGLGESLGAEGCDGEGRMRTLMGGVRAALRSALAPEREHPIEGFVEAVALFGGGHAECLEHPLLESAAEPDHGASWHRHFEAGFERLRDRYLRMLEWTLRQPRTIFTAFVILVASSGAAAWFIGWDFFPVVDAGQIRMHIIAPIGTRIEETGIIFSRMTEEIRRVVKPEDLDVIIDNIGIPPSTNLAYSDNVTLSSSDGELLVSLKPKHSISTGSISPAGSNPRIRP